MPAIAQCSICRQTVTCYYGYNETQTVSFKYKARNTNPATEVGFGQLTVQMRLAHGEGTYDTCQLAGKKPLNDSTFFFFPDEMFDYFYHDDEYPVTRFLRQPLYFEVGLLQSSDQRLELILENCWATANEDRNSTPSWDIIVNG